MFMYHVAPRSSRSDIAQRGLLPTTPRTKRWAEEYPPGVYLEPDLDVACDEAEARDGQLYEVDTRGLRLLPDPITAGCFYTTCAVPPEKIRARSGWTD